MTSEIRTNSLTSRAGLSTVTMTDSGPMFSGITTFVDNSGFTFGVGGGTSIFTPATNVLTFGTNNTEKIRIDASGHMHGVGVITATHFYGDGSNLTGITQTTINSNTNNYLITGTGTANTLQGESNLTFDGTNVLEIASGYPRVRVKNTGTSASANDIFGAIEFEHSDTDDAGITAKIQAVAEDNAGNSFLAFYNGDGGNADERLRIRSDGKVVIGTNYTGGTLSVTGNLITDDGTNGRVTIQADGTSTNQILSTTTGFGSYCNMKYQAADHIFLYGGTERLRIDSSGRVLIGTTTAGTGSGDDLTISNSSNMGLTLRSTSSNYCNIYFSDATSGTATYEGYISYNHATDSLEFATVHTERLRISSTGKVGINISDNTVADLQVRTGTNGAGVFRLGGASGNGIGMDMTYSNSGATSTIFKQNYRATHGSALMKFDSGYFTFHTGTSGDQLVTFTNNGGIGFFNTSSSLYGANTANAKGFYWDKGTASCQSASPRNTGWSSYYINKHDGNGGSENRYIDFWLNNGQQGNITISGSGLNYGSNSDYRLKKDEVVMTDGIARVKQLRPIKFKWIKDDIDDEGFFAHEAQAVVPIAVDGTKDQVVLQSEVDAGSQRENKSAGDPIYQTMDNSKLVPVLTASIKELITKVETLEQENIALRARVTNLEGN